MENSNRLYKILKPVGYSLVYIGLTLSVYILYDVIYSWYNANYGISLTWKYLKYITIFVIALSFIKQYKIRLIIISISLFFSLLQFYNYQFFGTFIQPIAFMQFFQNTGEVFESFFARLIEMIIPTLIIVTSFVILYFLNKRLDKKIFSLKIGIYIFAMAIVGHAMWVHSLLQPVNGKIKDSCLRLVYPRSNEHSYSNFIRSSNNLIVGILPKLISGKFTKFDILPTPVLKNENPDINIVFIIGESLRDDRLSLLGYDKKTTPRLDSLKEQNLIYSKSIISGGLMTNTALNALLNRMKYPGMTQTLEGSNNIIANAKRNHFSTYFISNQEQRSLNYLYNIAPVDKIDKFYCKEEIVQYLGNATLYDQDLVSMLQIINLNDNNFIILNQRGSHSPFKKQYPAEFAKFKSSYDNTVYYTDYVLGEIINCIKNNSKKETYIIFTSDHGELLGEHGKKGHGWYEKEVYTVPFVFMSLNSDKDYSEDLKNIKCHYDLSSFVTKLLGYEIVEKELDIREMYVGSSDLNSLAGYIKLKYNQNSLISREIIR